MANPEHLAIIKEGVEVWNRWRQENPGVRPDLSSAELSWAHLAQTNLSGVDLSKGDLRRASFFGARLFDANFSDADLFGADLCGAYLTRANFTEAQLQEVNLNGAYLGTANLFRAFLCRANLVAANLYEADLRKANLSDANLSGADLSRSKLIGADISGAQLSRACLERADLTSCRVYGISAWDVRAEGAIQKDLIITPSGQPIITVDNLDVAQFIYLLLNNEKLRQVIDTITSKVVLILGRFVDERKKILDAIREELRKRDYAPILFDFEKPASRDATETISTLAHMARFVIADITDAKSIPQELERIVPDLPSVPVQPLLAASETEYGMFEHFRRYPWVLEVYRYDNLDRLLASLREKVIAPAEEKARALRR